METTTFGPFDGAGLRGILVYADGDDVTGGDTKFYISLAVPKPHDGAVVALDIAAQLTGNGNRDILFGVDIGTPSGDTEALAVPIPKVFYVVLDLDTATSWGGDFSVTTWR